MSGQLARYLETLSRTQHELSSGFRALRHRHPREPDLSGVCERLAAQCRDHAARLEPFLLRYGSTGQRDHALSKAAEPGGSHAAEPRAPGTGSPGPDAPGLGANGFTANGFGAESLRPEGLGTGGFRAESSDIGRFGAKSSGFEGSDAGGHRPAGFDGGQFAGEEFAATGLDRAGLDAGGADGAGGDGTSFDGPAFDAAGFETARFEASAFEAAGREATDLRRVVRGAAERDRAGAEKADSAASRRPVMTPGRGGDAGLALLRDLQGLYLLATECDLSWSVVALAARGLRDDDLLGLARHCAPETAVQLLWLRTRMRQAAPQILIVPPR